MLLQYTFLSTARMLIIKTILNFCYSAIAQKIWNIADMKSNLSVNICWILLTHLIPSNTSAIITIMMYTHQLVCEEKNQCIVKMTKVKFLQCKMLTRFMNNLPSNFRGLVCVILGCCVNSWMIPIINHYRGLFKPGTPGFLKLLLSVMWVCACVSRAFT